ncbi:MAG: DUF502 domain-containing protein [Ignavibacteria bacterium]|nr:DUF502 domain-containing protein [Ignavibacteria bacterium]
MWEWLRNNFARGVVIIIPVVITVWLLNEVFVALDRIISPIFVQYGINVPGLGLATMLLLILIVGILSRNLIGKLVLTTFDSLMRRLPIVKTIYTAVKDVLAAFSASQGGKSFKQVVLIEYPRKGIYSIGFVTNEIRMRRARGKSGTKLISVYLAHPPNPTSGVMVMVPEKDVRVLKMSVEEGLKFALSAGIVTPKSLEDLGVTK